VALIDEIGNTDGSRWDEIILDFEWDHMINPLIAKYESQAAIQAVLTEASQKAKYCFSDLTIEAYIKKFDGEFPNYEGFEQFIGENKQVLIQQRLRRINQLVDN